MNNPRFTTDLQSVSQSDVHTTLSQKTYYEKEILKGRIWFAARDHDENLLGVLSLAPVRPGVAHLTILFWGTSRSNLLLSLEAVSLLTEHAFLTLGLTRVEVGVRSKTLSNFAQRLFILGYFPDGINESGWVKDGVYESTIQLGASFETFLKILGKRAGSLWVSDEHMYSIMSDINVKLKSPDLSLGCQAITTFINSQKAKSIQYLLSL